MKYDVLVVDPPWSYHKGAAPPRKRSEVKGGSGRGGRARDAYETMNAANFREAFRIEDFAQPNSHLYLWTTNPKLPLAFKVMSDWGYTYKTTLTWVKITKNEKVIKNGMGWFFRGATEHVLLGVRGKMGIPTALRKPNVILAQRGRHSQKPDEFYELLDAIYPSESKIDVFARKTRQGWDTWGDEV
jgi:N6-adenosine-specific RNA methylase IME4|tara:strand:+ start:441 stop:998 length:558 start_codon:yes stop_codon:yes gene_type:complete